MEISHDVIIIGAGLSGLAAAHFLEKARPGLRLLILEKNSRPGGAVQSLFEEGFHAEWGPHGFLNNTAESLEILTDLGLTESMQTAPLGSFVRFLCHRKKLEQLPQNPKQLLTTPLLSLPAKFRLLGDLFVAPELTDQTIGNWAARRFGPGVLHLIDAAVTGTFAGDYTKLSIDSVMPGLRDLEKEHGSILKGLKRKKKLASGSTLPAMVSFPGGMEQLTNTLAAGKPIRFGCEAQTVRPTPHGWQIDTDTDSLATTHLLVALPVNQSIKLLAPLQAPPVTTLPEARIINVAMGFSSTAQIPRGFGYLAPEQEKRFVLGAMFSTHMFPGRSPAGCHLLEVLVGGRRHPERLALDDATICKNAYEDIRQLLTLPDKPFFTKVLRPAGGIPQLEMDHPHLLQWRDALTQKMKNLSLCGFGWDGIGMNEMMKAAKNIAMRIIEEDTTETKRDVKPVYF